MNSTDGANRVPTMRNLLGRKGTEKGLAHHLPPISDVKDMFRDMIKKALSLKLEEALQHLKGRPLRIATCCSGTESPLLATEMICDVLRDLAATPLQFKHLFSAEIVPCKQAYIERNFYPDIIFRDIRELKNAFDDDPPMATTVYGARVLVPKDVDLLIAGTSCIDFSKLNNHQQGLERTGTGESSQTFYAVLEFVNKTRPHIVLIENVKTASWQKMLDEYETIGYATAGVYIDTKDYYIPQTRQRGYMICIDRAHALAEDAVMQWQDLMSALRRPASAPVTAFLLPPEQIQQRASAFTEVARDVEWVKCMTRQVLYREQQQLGHARPFTKWHESGTVSVPEGGNTSWYKRQTERVKDTIDCCILRQARKDNGMNDARYKTRVWDLSQHVDRFVDTGAFGISSCITPSGISFVSDASRVLAAEETLRLQGLPLDRISFTTETASELQDLAGNAMTTTAVGAAIVSAIICGAGAIPADADDCTDLEPEHLTSSLQDLSIEVPARTAELPEEFRLATISDRSKDKQMATLDISTTQLAHMAHSSRRRCVCEFGLQQTTSQIEVCQDCHHTACVRCSGDPSHSYKPTQSTARPDKSSHSFARTIRACLPLRLIFHTGHQLHDALVYEDPTAITYNALVKAAMECTFSMNQTWRTSSWTVRFDAPRAYLDIVMHQNRVAWYMSIRPSSDIPSDSSLRKVLQYPVARYLDSSDVVPVGAWEIRQPHQQQINVLVRGYGRQFPSWWARCKLPHYSKHVVWEFLEISSQDHPALQLVQGQYRHLPLCGTANDSLYINTVARPPVYLFRDPSRTGSPAQDCFVFAYDKESIAYDEVRPILARFEPAWSPWSVTCDEGKDSHWHNSSLSVDVWTPSH